MYKICSIRIKVTTYDVSFATKGVLPPPVATRWLKWFSKDLSGRKVEGLLGSVEPGTL